MRGGNKFCSRCVLPGSFPGISFGGDGVCNYCAGSHVPDDGKKREYLGKFEELLESIRGKHEFDVIMAYSGGKDSSYTMHLLAKKYGLRVLAFSFDNGFISSVALSNITRMTDALGPTSIILRPPFGLLRDVFRFSAVHDIYSPKTLDRASSICTTCIGMVKSQVLKLALRMNIPLVAFGWSPGQAPIASAVMQTNPRLQRLSHASVRDPLLRSFGRSGLGAYFLSDSDLETEKGRWPVNIHPLAFVEYNEEEIIKTIRGLGWVKPSDTDPNSTNCLLNALANYLHKKRFGFHPYAWEIAGIVRSNSMSRDDGLEKTTQDEDMGMVRYAAEKLDINMEK
jgi:tRNA(Ile)-lysidine synthase TilS/MesJ